MKESRTCKWENFSCNGKWKKFQLGKPQEYELFLGKPQEYELFLGEPQEYELFLGKPQKYELFLGKPQEYELFFCSFKTIVSSLSFSPLDKDVIGFKCILPSFSSFNFRRETCKNFDEAFNGKQRNMFFFLFHYPHHRLFLCRLYFLSFSLFLYFSLKPLPLSFYFLPH